MNKENNAEQYLSISDISIYNQIVKIIYEDGVPEEILGKTLNKLKDLIYYDSAIIYILERVNGQLKVRKLLTPGVNEKMQKRYLDNYFVMDDTLSLVSGDRLIVYRASDIFDLDYRVRTDFYIKFLHPTGMEYSLEENFDMARKCCYGGLSIHRGNAHKDFSEKDLELFRLFQPHLSCLAQKLYSTRIPQLDFASEKKGIERIERIAYCVWDESMEPIENNFIERNFIEPEHINQLLNISKKYIAMLKKKSQVISNKEESRYVVSIEKTLYYLDILLFSNEKNHMYRYLTLIHDYNTMLHNLINYHCKKSALTKRESEILKCVMQGMSNAGISLLLNIELSTVKTHLNNVYSKLEIDGKHQLFSIVMGKEHTSTTS